MQLFVHEKSLTNFQQNRTHALIFTKIAPTTNRPRPASRRHHESRPHRRGRPPREDGAATAARGRLNTVNTHRI